MGLVNTDRIALDLFETLSKSGDLRRVIQEIRARRPDDTLSLANELKVIAKEPPIKAGISLFSRF